MWRLPIIGMNILLLLIFVGMIGMCLAQKAAT